MSPQQTEASQALLVRYRNDGDDFHILWSARRALRLLDPASGLVGVAIEGPSEAELKNGAGVDAGLLVIDTAEYYGPSLQKLERIVYFQLKYSTTASTTPWPVSGLEATLKGFSERFKKFRAKKRTFDVRFAFVTNRPISPTVIKAFQGKANDKPTRDTLAKLNKITGLTGAAFADFSACMDFHAEQEPRSQQESKLQAEAAQFIGQADSISVMQMKSLIQRQTTSDAAKRNTITLSQVADALGTLEEDLLPAPPRFEKAVQLIPRAQEGSIAKRIIGATQPLVIHAGGGIGKSVLAQRLPALMPAGSEVVIFDGFASGGYRSARDRRHLHRRGLTHIANTLASRGLCNILIPTRGVGDDAYLQMLRNRLAQASLAVRRRSTKALVVIVLDAADNSVMAAIERGEKAFAPDLLQEPPPDGCRLVALARSHRLDLLRLEPGVIRLQLDSFSRDESAAHLAQKFSSADAAAIDRFHKFTDANPRVQANALANSASLAALLPSLGSSIRKVEKLINDQLDAALAKLKSEQHGDKRSIEALCRCLAVLPPLIPLATLARAAGVRIDEIRSFASDFAAGRPLLVKDGAIQFRDEPVETWFRDRFAANPRDYAKIVDALRQSSDTDSYIAASMPQLLLGAGRYAELLALALTGQPFKKGGAVEQREVSLRRVRFALKAAIEKGRMADAAKLMLRAGEEVAVDDRVSNFMLENADWIAAFNGAESVYEYIFRRRAWHHSKIGYAHCAVMLAHDTGTRLDAQRFLKMAMGWLHDWARTPGDKRKIRLDDDDIAEHYYALHLLQGPKAVADDISTWTPKSLSFEVGRFIAVRLLDRGNIPSTLELLAAAGNNLHLRIGVIAELSQSHATPAPADVAATVALLESATDDELKSDNPLRSYRSAIISALELAARTGVSKNRLLPLLSRFRPAHQRVLGHFDKDRSAFFRFVALEAVLQGLPLEVANLVPTDLQAVVNTPAAENNDEVRNFRRIYNALAPWYEIRALAVIKTLANGALSLRLKNASAASSSDSSWYSEDHERVSVANDIPLVWTDSLCWGTQAKATELSLLSKWVNSQARIYTPTLTRLAQVCARAGATSRAIEFASRSKALTLGEPSDAAQTAEYMVKLARALYVCSKPEALSYFKLAMERLGRFGDETYDRLFSLAKLAERAGDSGGSYPREAYRLARIAEVLEAHNDHDFPWPHAASAVASLSAPSAFAIAARWHDRRKTSLEDSIAPMVKTLLRRRRVDPRIAASLHVFSGYWSLAEKPEAFFSGLNKPDAQRVLDCLLRDCEFDRSRESLEPLLQFSRTLGLANDRIKERVAFNARPTETASARVPQMGTKIQRRRPLNWAKVLVQCDLSTSAGIERALVRYRASSPTWEWGSFFAKMRSRVRPNDRPAHIHALAQSSLSSSLTLEALEAARSSWTTSQSVQDAIRDAVPEVIRTRSTDLARNRWAREEISRCRDLGGLTDSSVLTKLTSALSDHIDGIAAASWFYLAGEVTHNCLKPGEALDVLSYGLDQLEPLIDPEMGDGPWRTDLAPPKDIESAVAGFLFAQLCAPDADDRWRAAHAVRRLCAFNLQKVLLPLVRFCSVEALPAFSDHRLPFYIWNGRLYAMIAFARAVLESPAALKPHIRFLVDWALNREPHVLIRHFAAKTALHLSTLDPRTTPSATTTKLREVNVSRFPLAPLKKGLKVGWTTDFWRARGFGFPYDFDRYWIGPLAEAFNLDGKKVAKRVTSWIIDKWGQQHKGAWNDDPRAKAGFFKDRGTEADHGGHPSVDRLSFYLSYHAMFCAAGDMLAQLPTSAAVNWAGDPNKWPYWFNGHLLTREDGQWLSDARDFAPLELRRWEKTREDKDWRYSILADDFDEVLGIVNGKTPKTLPIWGNWNCSYYSQKEDIGVSSALVDPDASLSLLRALQLYDSFTDFRLPPERDEYESAEPGFELRGWIHSPDGSDRGLDKFDPLASNVRWPPPIPGRLLRRFWKLKPAGSAREWSCGQNTVLSTLTWGSEQDRNESSGNCGNRMSIKTEFLKRVLKSLRKDMIIEISFRRDDGSKKEIPEYRHAGSARLYVLKATGELHTLNGSRRLWRTAS